MLYCVLQQGQESLVSPCFSLPHLVAAGCVASIKGNSFMWILHDIGRQASVAAATGPLAKDMC